MWFCRRLTKAGGGAVESTRNLLFSSFAGEAKLHEG
jgi:hypothetical protein